MIRVAALCLFSHGWFQLNEWSQPDQQKSTYWHTPHICLCSFQALAAFVSIIWSFQLARKPHVRRSARDANAIALISAPYKYAPPIFAGFLICLQVSSWSSPGPLSYLFSDHSLEVGYLPLSYPSPLDQLQNLHSTPTLRVRRLETGIPIHKLALSLQHLPQELQISGCTVASVPNDCITGLSQATISSFPTSICPQWPVPDNKHHQNKCVDVGWNML